MRRSLGLALACAAVGCGLAFSPGDYGGKATATTDAGSSSGVLPDGAPVGTDGGTPAPLAHLVVFAGAGADGGVATSDVWTATFDQAGNVGSFVYNAPVPLLGPVSAETVDESSLHLAMYESGNRVVLTPTWDSGIVPVGYATDVANTSSPPGYGNFFAGTMLVSIGGVTVGDDGNGGTTYDYDAGIWLSQADGGHYTDAGLSPALPPVGFQDVVIATYQSFVYFNGRNVTPGDTSAAEQASKIYVGTLDPTVGVTNVQVTQTMLDANQSPYTPLFPMFCAGDGYLFVAGGFNDGDVTVLYAAIHADGTLDPWKPGPNLPAPLYQAGCVVYEKALYLVGGWSGEGDGAAGAASDQILKWSVDGSGWESAGRLPAARSSILARIY